MASVDNYGAHNPHIMANGNVGPTGCPDCERDRLHRHANATNPQITSQTNPTHRQILRQQKKDRRDRYGKYSRK